MYSFESRNDPKMNTILNFLIRVKDLFKIILGFKIFKDNFKKNPQNFFLLNFNNLENKALDNFLLGTSYQYHGYNIIPLNNFKGTRRTSHTNSTPLKDLEGPAGATHTAAIFVGVAAWASTHFEHVGVSWGGTPFRPLYGNTNIWKPATDWHLFIPGVLSLHRY